MAITRGVTTKRLVSAIASLDEREINPNVIDIGLDGGFDDLMRVVGRYKKTDQPYYEHFVNDDVTQIITIDTAGVTGSGTATLTMTINTSGFVRQGDTLLFNNDKVGIINSAITTASSKDSFTCQSVDGSNLTAAAGDKMSVGSTTVGEKSKEVGAITYGLTKYFNQYQTVRDETSMTDVQKNSTVTVGDGYYTYLQAQQQAKAFKLRLSSTLIAGVKSINQYGTAAPTLVDKDGGSIQTTGGLNQEVTNYGVNDSVTTLGAPNMADIDDLLDQLNAVKAPAEYLLLTPDKAWRQYDNLFKNLGSAGITSARLNMDGQEVNYNVKTFTKGKFSLEFGPLNLLDHPQQFNFPGASSIGKNIYGIPKDKVKVQSASTGGASSLEVRVGVRFAPNPNASKRMGTEYVAEMHTGGLAEVPTSSEQVLNVEFIARQGLECLGTKQMFKQRVLV